MKQKYFLALAILGIIVVSACIQESNTPGSNEDKKFCNIDSDCVPASCCHPNDVVNKKYTPDCTDIGCTASCESILDCGCGKPVCLNNNCEVQKISSESWCP